MSAAEAAMQLRLMSREACELCEQMHEALVLHPLAARLQLQLVDVDSDPVLQRRFGLRVPVLVDAWDEVLCEGRLDPQALADALAEMDSRAGRRID